MWENISVMTLEAICIHELSGRWKYVVFNNNFQSCYVDNNISTVSRTKQVNKVLINKIIIICGTSTGGKRGSSSGDEKEVIL